jgi:hypothetical protein
MGNEMETFFQVVAFVALVGVPYIYGVVTITTKVLDHLFPLKSQTK